jgi:hypothetical protein
MVEMIDSWKRVFDEIQKMPIEEQERYAQWILAEIEDDRKWDQKFAETRDEIEILGQQAMEQHRAGLTEDLDPDNLG